MVVNIIENKIVVEGEESLTKLQKSYAKLEKQIFKIQKRQTKNKVLFDARTRLKLTQKDIAANKQKLQLMKQQNMERNKLVGAIRAGQDAQIGFNGAALSGLFFGMALQRVFGGALKSIFEGYKKIIPEADEFNKMTTRLSANWEFFKFQMADALANSPLFQKFVAGIINVIKQFQKLSEESKVALGVAFAGLFALGGLLLVGGTIQLGLAGMLDSFGLINAESGKFTWGKLKSFGVLILVAIALAAVKVAWDKFADSSELAKEKTENLGKANEGFLKQLSNMFESVTGITNLFEDWGAVWVFLGAIIQNFVALAGTGIAFLMKNWTIQINEQIMDLKKWATEWVNSGLDILDIAYKIASATDELFGTNFASGIARAMASLNSMKGGLLDTTEQLTNIANAQATYNKQVEDYGNALISPIAAVQAYNKELEESRKSQEFISNLQNQTGLFDNNMLDNVSSVSPSTNATNETTYNYTTIVDSIEAAKDAGFIDDKQVEAYQSLVGGLRSTGI